MPITGKKFLPCLRISFSLTIVDNNFRFRRPIYNVLPTGWKNQIPMRAVSLNNRPILPQRVPTKEFYSINKVPEYSPEYRPELVALPPTHRGGVDDDKGPIHTIPAPNLSPADKPPIRFNTATNLEDLADQRPYPTDLNYQSPAQSTNFYCKFLLQLHSELGKMPRFRRWFSSMDVIFVYRF